MDVDTYNVIQENISNPNANLIAAKYEGNYQVDISSTVFEIETIVSSYTGLMRLHRLCYVADHCAALRQETLFIILKHLEPTHFVSLYKKIVEELRSQHVSLPSEFDLSWYEKTQRSFAQKLDKLDTDLRNSRSNSIKDLIRRGHDDLGDHYSDAGDYFNAVRCYVRSRDYCVSPKQIVNMCLNVIKASIYMENWSNVLAYVSKAEQAMESFELVSKSAAVPNSTDPSSKSVMTESDIILSSRLKAYAGIAQLAAKRYKLAARHFLNIPFAHCSNHLQDVISPQTLIQYVCLCALSAYDRSELQHSILLSVNVKQYLELEPTINEIVTKFHETSYSSCLALLQQMEPIFALDCYLAGHLKIFYYEIRRRIIITYFYPYKNASMLIMAKHLNTTVDLLEDELVQLIRTGKLQARIDSKNKILYVADTDQRWTAYQHALKMTQRTKYITQMTLLRSAIIKGNFQVKDESIGSFLRAPNDAQLDMYRQLSIIVPGNPKSIDEHLSNETAMN